MDENSIRRMIQEEIAKDKQSFSGKNVPPHDHDGADNLLLQPENILGFQQLSNKRGGVVYENTFQNAATSVQELAGNLTVYPVPIFSSGHLGSFNGGTAPEGTIIAGNDGVATTFNIWVNIGGDWYTVALTPA